MFKYPIVILGLTGWIDMVFLYPSGRTKIQASLKTVTIEQAIQSQDDDECRTHEPGLY